MKSSPSLTVDLIAPFLGDITDKVPDGVLVEIEQTNSHQQAITVTANCSIDFTRTTYDDPHVYVQWLPHSVEAASQVNYLGFQCSEFALPVRASNSDLDFNFFNRPNYKRPHSVFPFFSFDSTSGQCLLLAPLDNFHEQVFAVNTLGNRELRWGWSGDLTFVPKNFRTTLGVYVGSSPRDLLCIWGAQLRALAGKSGPCSMPGRYADISTAKLSMWTDNGSSYWYRTESTEKEGFLDLPTTLERTIQHLDAHDVPVASVELDSWFYDHEIPRRICALSYPDVVPPTGLTLWEPRKDALKSGGVTGLRKRLGQRPLILHNRHISAQSPYVNTSSGLGNWWIDNGRAHPMNEKLFHRWMGQAADWGATAYEQDWLIEIWQGIRQLREIPGRIAKWQDALDKAASKYGIKLIWCMATPADFALAVSLDNVVSIRTSDDYRYAADASDLWRWHLTVNCLAKALGLWPFKDVFMSHTNNDVKVNIEGDPNCELEALLSCMSAGPVAIGDRLGRTNKSIVMRTCRTDGIIIKPDVPLCAMDRSLTNHSGLLWADTNSGDWRYIVAINATKREEQIRNLQPSDQDGVPIEEKLELGNDSPVLVYNWRSKTAEVASSLHARLCSHEWNLWVVCPIYSMTEATYAIIGDTSVYATMGDRRMRMNKGEDGDPMSFDVVGEPGERVNVTYWNLKKGLTSVQVPVGAAAWSRLELPSRS